MNDEHFKFVCEGCVHRDFDDNGNSCCVCPYIYEDDEIIESRNDEIVKNIEKGECEHKEMETRQCPSCKKCVDIRTLRWAKDKYGEITHLICSGCSEKAEKERLNCKSDELDAGETDGQLLKTIDYCFKPYKNKGDN